MKIVDIVSLDKRKSKIILEGQECFALYKGEIYKYGLVEGMELSESLRDDIYENILYKRGKERALYILKDSDKTEFEMRSKLKKGFYPDCVIDRVLSFLAEYGFVNDQNYVENYIRCYYSGKSRMYIVQKLMQKGIAKDLILNTYEEICEPDDENERRQICILLKKKHYNAEESDLKEKNRIMGFLVRRGFRLDDIQYCMRNYDDIADEYS